MAEVQITPVKVRMKNGEYGEVDRIDVTAQTDQLLGTRPQTSGSSEQRPSAWDMYGTCRDASDKENLDYTDTGVVDVKETAKRLTGE